MNFSKLFEFHKIPEWYPHYFNYKHFSTQLREQMADINDSQSHSRLRGIYFLTEQNKLEVVPIVSELPEHLVLTQAELVAKKLGKFA